MKQEVERLADERLAEELRVAYEIVHSGMIDDAKVVGTMSRNCHPFKEEALDVNQDYESFVQQYTSLPMLDIKVVGNFKGCTVTLHIHR